LSHKLTGNIGSIISRDCEVKGHVTAKSSIRVDGKVEGNVISGDGVFIGEHAVVKGDVSGKHVVIGGKVTGDVTASAKLEILNTGKLHGDISSPKLMMAEGVSFEGSVVMAKQEHRQ